MGALLLALMVLISRNIVSDWHDGKKTQPDVFNVTAQVAAVMIKLYMSIQISCITVKKKSRSIIVKSGMILTKVNFAPLGRAFASGAFHYRTPEMCFLKGSGGGGERNI